MANLCLKNVRFLNENEFDLIMNENYNIGLMINLNESLSISNIFQNIINSLKAIIKRLIEKFKKTLELMKNRYNEIKKKNMQATIDKENTKRTRSVTINTYDKFFTGNYASFFIDSEMMKKACEICDELIKIYFETIDGRNDETEYERKYNDNNAIEILLGKPLEEYYTSLIGEKRSIEIYFANIKDKNEKMKETVYFLPEFNIDNINGLSRSYNDNIGICKSQIKDFEKMKAATDDRLDISSKNKDAAKNIAMDIISIYNAESRILVYTLSLINEYTKFLYDLYDACIYTDSNGNVCKFRYFMFNN